MMTRFLTAFFLLIAYVAGNSVHVEDDVNVEKVSADALELGVTKEDSNARNLYHYKKSKKHRKYDDDDDCDDDCDCDDVIKAFENFFDCCVEESRRRLHWGGSTSSSSSKSSKKPKHCGYDKDFSDDVNEAIKCCEFDDLVDAL
mmetsp:Transcript_4945/g.10902  ORF Transcript_4945/g.10902 Transcript_4945/m.10902 type:complete len:144 (-) Transcript_4945:380-811(-)